MIRMLKLAPVLALALAAGAGPASAAFQCDKFQKNPDGTWAAKEPVEIFGPNGRLDFVPGETYREGQPKAGLDIAKLLAANCDKKS